MARPTRNRLSGGASRSPRAAPSALACASGSAWVYLAAAAIFGRLFGLSAGLLYPVGAFLVVFAATLLLLASRPTVSRPAVAVVIALNIAWVAASVEVLVAGWFPLTALGVALVVAQAVVVAGFAALQIAGLRRTAF